MNASYFKKQPFTSPWLQKSVYTYLVSLSLVHIIQHLNPPVDVEHYQNDRVILVTFGNPIQRTTVMSDISFWHKAWMKISNAVSEA